MKKLLLIIDAQYDFINGSLAVDGAEEKMINLSNHIKSNDYDSIYFTIDWHPFNHSSFIENNGKWPKHCVQYTHGASIYNDVIYEAYKKCKDIKIFGKGMNPTKDSYSILDETIMSRLFLMSMNNFDEIYVCGICGDICVKYTIIDMIKYDLNNKLTVLRDFCPSIDKGIELNKLIQENELKYV